MEWRQYTVELTMRARGCHLITNEVLAALTDLRQFKVGLLHLFLQHTSASLTINENADPSVRNDLEMALNHLAPETLAYTHTEEGRDDMPAHVKCSLLGHSLTIPIAAGRLALGTWQGLYLWEHRNNGSSRYIVATISGCL